MIDETLPILEAAALERVRNVGGEELVARLVTTFLDAAPSRVEALSAAATAGDLDGTGKAAHSLKSMAGNVGAVRLQALVEAIEVAALNGDLLAVRAGGEEIEMAYARVAEWLSELVAGNEDGGDG